MNRSLCSDMRQEITVLREFTHDCRQDMHEPDEQGLTAKVRGKRLDNAFGSSLTEDELVVILKRDGKEGLVNLASLIALARVGINTLMEEHSSERFHLFRAPRQDQVKIK